MKSPLFQRILSLLAGVLVSGGLISLVEGLGHRLYPPPAALMPDPASLADPAALEAYKQVIADYVATAPLVVLLFPVAAWGIGAMGGAWVAARWAPLNKRRNALLIGALVMLGTLTNLASIPHPNWMWAAGPLSVAAGTWLGARLAGVLDEAADEGADSV